MTSRLWHFYSQLFVICSRLLPVTRSLVLQTILIILFCFLVCSRRLFGVTSSSQAKWPWTPLDGNILRLRRPQHHDVLATTVRSALQPDCQSEPLPLYTVLHHHQPSTESHERFVEKFVLAAAFAGCRCSPHEISLHNKIKSAPQYIFNS